jgi:adenosylcobinamide-GDP ribazoletransferase
MPAGEQARAAVAAVAFLTRLPVGRLVVVGGGDVARGAAFFPLVGAGIGAAVGGTAAGLVHILPALAAAGIALGLGALLTGGLHLDALADTADALSARSPERALTIMRDHATGAFGATALALDLIVKAAALAALAAGGHAIAFAVVAGTLGRAVPVGLGATLPGVRSDGIGSGFAGSLSRTAAATAAGLALVIAFAAAGVHGLELAGIAVLSGVALGLLFFRWLGGTTGDLLGAAAELTETLTLVAAAALTGSQ